MNIVGHDNVIESLKRLAKNKTLSHGYLFYGPAMVGKCLVAKSLAGFLENGEFHATDILVDGKVIAPNDKETIGIDAVREIKNFLWQKPIKSERRTVVIDRGEKMTAEAQNALLKIAEEPPASSLLILVASDGKAIFQTLASRLEKFYFPTVKEKKIFAWLKDELKIKSEEARKFARASFGAPGLALSLKNDKKFTDLLRTAEKFLKLKSGRKEFIKDLIDEKDFKFSKFIDAVIFCLASEPKTMPTSLWHRLLELRKRNEDFSLNPRLQLENLNISRYK